MVPERRRPVRALRVALAVPLLGAALVLAANAWIAFAVRGRARDEAAALPARAVAIVPGTRVSARRPMPLLEERLVAALSLYRAGRVRAILVSGLETDDQPEASVMRTWLRDRGVPDSAILVDAGGSRTRETVLRAAALYDVRSAIICTQDLNMPRALYLAERSGIDAVGLAVHAPVVWPLKTIGVEALKSTVAFVESALPSSGVATSSAVVASR
jgi:vancomycin permeability regulator SanA